MARDGLDDALSRFGGAGESEPEPKEESGGKSEESKGGHKGHIGHIHKHDNGTHHVTVHDKNNQLVHHSEHGSWQEAARELGTHGANQSGTGEGQSPAGEY